ncbi:MAG: hypothetical protein ABIT83_08210 [Massilia sp.]
MKSLTLLVAVIAGSSFPIAHAEDRRPNNPAQEVQQQDNWQVVKPHDLVQAQQMPQEEQQAALRQQDQSQSEVRQAEVRQAERTQTELRLMQQRHQQQQLQQQMEQQRAQLQQQLDMQQQAQRQQLEQQAERQKLLQVQMREQQQLLHDGPQTAQQLGGTNEAPVSVQPAHLVGPGIQITPVLPPPGDQPAQNPEQTAKPPRM